MLKPVARACLACFDSLFVMRGELMQAQRALARQQSVEEACAKFEGSRAWGEHKQQRKSRGGKLTK